MSGLNRSFNLLRGVMRPQIIPKANISSKPAKHVLSAGVSMTISLAAHFDQTHGARESVTACEIHLKRFYI